MYACLYLCSFCIVYYFFILPLDIPTLLEVVTPGCPGSVLLPCVANGATSISFQVFEVNGNRFLTLTSLDIQEDPDYEKLQVNNEHALRVVNTEKHNGSQFRCTGFINRKRVYSNVVKVLLAGEFVWCRCSSL